MTNRIVIIGAGGHGQVVAECLRCAIEGGSDMQVVGFVDSDSSLVGTSIMGKSVLGTPDELNSVPHDCVIVAIGNNRVRQSIFHMLASRGEEFGNAVHPHATIASHVTIGKGTVITAGVVVNTGTIIGENSILNTSCSVDHHNTIGSHVHIGPGVHLGGNVVVDDGVLIGISGTIMPGRRIGEWSVVGAGACVTKDVCSHTTVVGVPARKLESGNA